MSPFVNRRNGPSCPAHGSGPRFFVVVSTDPKRLPIHIQKPFLPSAYASVHHVHTRQYSQHRSTLTANETKRGKARHPRNLNKPATRKPRLPSPPRTPA